MQLMYAGKTKRYLPKSDFPRNFNVTFTKNHWSNMEKAVEHFEKVIFPFFQKTKEEYNYPKEQMSLVVMDTFKGQKKRWCFLGMLESMDWLMQRTHNFFLSFFFLFLFIQAILFAAWSYVSENVLYATHRFDIKTDRNISIQIRLLPLHCNCPFDRFAICPFRK